jgi:hypothetical protein
MDTSRRVVFQRRARAVGVLRAAVFEQLYPVISNPTAVSVRGGASANMQLIAAQLGLQAAGEVVGSVNRLAGTLSTVNDSSHSGGGASGVGAGLERQVERAMAQVLGRSPGGSGAGFALAVRESFPVEAYGKDPSATPVRSVVSLGAGTKGRHGLGGQLSAQQAALCRQGSLLAADAAMVLASLNSFVPTADADQVEALRVRVRDDIQALGAEFGRLDEPRRDLVKSRFVSLDLHLAEFGRAAQFGACDNIVTPADEGHSAGYKLLQNYALALRAAWERFREAVDDKGDPDECGPLGLRIERARRILPIIVQGNRDLMNALDSVGFTENERRSEAARFTALKGIQSLIVPSATALRTRVGSASTSALLLGDPRRTLTGPGSEQNPVAPWLPESTMSDFIDWIDRYAAIESNTALSDSGVYGLNFVTDQADRLFWVVAPVIAYMRTTTSANLVSRSMLGQVLSHERVRWALDNLLGQFHALANLAVG